MTSTNPSPSPPRADDSAEHRATEEQDVAPSRLCTFDDLIAPFGGTAPRVELVTAEQMPAPAARLLAHRRHMTVTLEKRLASKLALEVLATRHQEPHYTRCIRLTSERTGELGLFGIMRFDLRTCAPETREEILQGVQPLGRVLIASGALRTIHLHRLIHIPNGGATLRYFGSREQDAPTPEANLREEDDAADNELWGRLASIHCDGEPAVDLVEILSPHLCV